MTDKSSSLRDNSPPHTIESDVNQTKTAVKGTLRHSDTKFRLQKQFQKLRQLDTRQRGLTELKKLTDADRSPQFLHLILTVIKDSRPSPPLVLESELQLIVFICEIYKTRLVDPKERPVGLVKTATRVVEIVKGYMKEVNQSVASACAQALLGLQKFCLSEMTDSEIVNIVFNPIRDLVKSSDKAFEQSAAMCIKNIIEDWHTNNKTILLKLVLQDLITMFLKTTPKYHEIHTALALAIELCQFDLLPTVTVENILTKSLTALTANHSQTHFRSFMGKVTLCKLFAAIAKQLLRKPKTINQTLTTNIINCLNQNRKNRVVHVQQQAKNALQFWIRLNGQDPSAMNTLRVGANTSGINNAPASRPRSLMQARHSFKSDKYMLKQQQESLPKVDKKSLSPGKRDFMKRKSGTGGGYFGVPFGGGKHSQIYHRGVSQLQQIIRVNRGSKIKNDPFDVKCIGFGSVSDIQNPTDRKQAEKQNQIGQKQTQKLENPIGQQKMTKKQDQGDPKKEDNDDSLDFEQDHEQGEQAGLPQPSIVKQIRQTSELSHDQSKKQNILVTPKPNIPDLPHKDENSLIIKQISGKSEEESIHKSQQKIDHDGQNSQDKNYPFIKVSPPVSELKSDRKSHLSSLRSKLQMQSQQIIPNQRQILKPSEAAQLAEQNNLSDVSSYLGQVLSAKQVQRLTEQINLQPHLKLNGAQCLKSARDVKKDLKRSFMKFTNKKSEVQSVACQAIQDFDPVVEEKKEKNQVWTDINDARQSRFQKTLKQQVQRYDVQLQINEFIRNPDVIRRDQNNLKIIHQESFHINSNQQPSPIFSQQQHSQIKIAPQQNSPQQQSALQGWKRVLKSYNHGQLSQAYDNCIQLKDDLYLLRLLLLKQPNLKQLSRKNIRDLWDSFLTIYTSQAIQATMLGLLQQANQLNILQNSLSLSDGDYILSSIYNLSGKSTGSLSFRSAKLYNSLHRQLKH